MNLLNLTGYKKETYFNFTNQFKFKQLFKVMQQENDVL